MTRREAASSLQLVAVVLAALVVLTAAKPPPRAAAAAAAAATAAPARRAQVQAGRKAAGRARLPASDSGRSMLEDSELADALRGTAQLDDADELNRGQQPGLVPRQAQAHLALQRGYRQLEAPLLDCRSRFADALRQAGPEAQRAASAAVESARDILDKALAGALDDLPADFDPDPELEAIQHSLVVRDRGPAGDVMEERLKRLILQSVSPPDDGVLEARRLFRSLQRPVWQAVDAMLPVPVPGDKPGARDTLAKFRSCLQHRLQPDPLH